MIHSRRTLAKAALAALVPLATLAAMPSTQAAYPERPITLIVPYAPGGAADSLARTLGAPHPPRAQRADRKTYLHEATPSTRPKPQLRKRSFFIMLHCKD